MSEILFRGETKKIVVNLTDANGTARNITGQAGARAGLSRSPDSSPYLTRDQVGADLEVTEDPASVAILLSDEESAGLPLGPLYAQVWVQIDGKWIACEPVSFEVRAGIGGP